MVLEMVGEPKKLHCRKCLSDMTYDPLNRTFYCHQCQEWYGLLVQSYLKKEDTRKHGTAKDVIYIIIAGITIILGFLLGFAGVAGAGTLCCIIRMFAGGALGFGGAKALIKHYNYNQEVIDAVPEEYKCNICQLPLIPDYEHDTFYCERCGFTNQLETKPNKMREARAMSTCKKCKSQMKYDIESEKFKCNNCD